MLTFLLGQIDPEERMITLERSLAQLVKEGKIAALEAEKWANNPSTFLQELNSLTRNANAAGAPPDATGQSK